eukprot:m.92306 g.92306  ORF g.92306 m.92306 type:complete len:348 (+) comp15065_c0_seq2:1301-2344(+)
MDVWVDSATAVEMDVFVLWVRGLTVDQATLCRTAALVEHTRSIVQMDTQSQFMLFNALEPYLQTPTTLAQQCLFTLPADQQHALVQSYYRLSTRLLRELVGKSLTSRTRKDLDEYSERCSLTLQASRRQFDNVRRVYKALEDKKGSLCEAIQQEFLLDEGLAKLYAQLLFLFDNKLSLDNKKLDTLPFEDIAFCVEQMIVHWTDAENQQDLEKQFLQELREFKYIVWNHKDYLTVQRKLVCERFEPAVQPRVAAALKLVGRNMLGLGAGLSHSKELRDVFEDLLELVVLPFHQNGLMTAHVMAVFQALQETFSQLPLSGELQTRFEPTHTRFLLALAPVVVRLQCRL